MNGLLERIVSSLEELIANKETGKSIKNECIAIINGFIEPEYKKYDLIRNGIITMDVEIYDDTYLISYSLGSRISLKGIYFQQLYTAAIPRDKLKLRNNLINVTQNLIHVAFAGLLELKEFQNAAPYTRFYIRADYSKGYDVEVIYGFETRNTQKYIKTVFYIFDTREKLITSKGVNHKGFDNLMKIFGFLKAELMKGYDIKRIQQVAANVTAGLLKSGISAETGTNMRLIANDVDKQFYIVEMHDPRTGKLQQVYIDSNEMELSKDMVEKIFRQRK